MLVNAQHIKAVGVLLYILYSGIQTNLIFNLFLGQTFRNQEQ